MIFQTYDISRMITDLKCKRKSKLETKNAVVKADEHQRYVHTTQSCLQMSKKLNSVTSQKPQKSRTPKHVISRLVQDFIA